MKRSLFFAVSMLALPVSASADDWDWTATPYLWGASVTLDASINDQQVLGAEVSFEDLLDDLDFGFMLHVEGRNGNHGAFGDLLFIDLGDEPRTYDALGLTITAEADPEVLLLDVGGVYYPSADGSFGIHYGVRIFDVDQEIDIFAPGSPLDDRRIVDASETFIDGVLGARFKTPLSDKWTLALSADYAAGDSDGSWNLLAALGYTLGAQDQYAIQLAYRHIQLEFESEDTLALVETEMTMSGPALGFSFRF